MKVFWGLLVAVFLCFGTSACGGSSSAEQRASLISAQAPSGAGSEATVQAEINNGSRSGYLGDQDTDIGGIRENQGYHDSDDNSLSFSAHARVAGTAEARTITALVNRYYSLAAAEDGTRACSMLPLSLVRAMPLDYGKLGPSYLHGARTCSTITTRIFKHNRRDWAFGVAVTGVVLIDADHAAVMVGSTKAPASSIVLQRENGAWKIASLLARGME